MFFFSNKAQYVEHLNSCPCDQHRNNNRLTREQCARLVAEDRRTLYPNDNNINAEVKDNNNNNNNSKPNKIKNKKKKNKDQGK